MKKTVLSRVFSLMLALFLALSLLGCAAIAYAGWTVADPENVKKAVIACSYGETLREEIAKKWDNLLSICGIADTSPMLEILTEDRVQADVLTYFADAYHSKQTVDTKSLEEELEAKLWEYTATLENADPEDQELQKNVRDLASACMEEYRISIRVPLLHNVLGAITRYKKWMLCGGLVLAVFSVLLLVFLFFLQRQRRDIFYFAALATATDTLLILGGGLFARGIDLVNRLPLAQSALRDLAVLCASNMLTKLLITGTVLLAVTVLLLLLYILTGRRKQAR